MNYLTPTQALKIASTPLSSVLIEENFQREFFLGDTAFKENSFLVIQSLVEFGLEIAET